MFRTAVRAFFRIPDDAKPHGSTLYTNIRKIYIFQYCIAESPRPGFYYSLLLERLCYYVVVRIAKCGWPIVGLGGLDLYE